MQELLTVDHLKTVFMMDHQRYEAIKDVSFSLHENEILGIVGESGSGKSLLMKSILKLLPSNASIESGKITFLGEEIQHFSEKEMNRIRGKEISMIFQDPMTALNPLRKIGFHVTEILHRFEKLTNEEAEKKAEQLLSSVGISNAKKRMNQYPHEFSGGMRQRVLIAMAMACDPKILIADEPTTALDVTIQAQILDLLQEKQKESQNSIILITHDLGVIASRCQRVLVMYGARVMEEGTVDEIFYQAKHPYTQALLQSIAKIDEKKDRLATIPGMAPTLGELNEGCPFYVRCSKRTPNCKNTFPNKHLFTDTHCAYCHNIEEASHE